MTLRLLDLAASHWDLFDGWCAGRGLDPWRLPAHRMLSLIYFWANQFADDKQRLKFDMRLYMPPPGEVAEEGPWTPEAEMQGFRGLASSLNMKTEAPEASSQ